MANRGDVISVDKLWDIFDLEREKAWEGVDAPIGSQEWKAAAGKIDTINNICEAVHDMNTCSRADGEKAKKAGLEGQAKRGAYRLCGRFCGHKNY